MEKESYSIDDILSEVKRRRESENREQANTEAQVSAQTFKQAEPEKKIEAEPKLKDDIKVQQPEVKVSVAEDKPTKTEVFIEKEEGNNFNYSSSSCNDCCGRCVCDFLCK